MPLPKFLSLPAAKSEVPATKKRGRCRPLYTTPLVFPALMCPDWHPDIHADLVPPEPELFKLNLEMYLVERSDHIDAAYMKICLVVVLSLVSVVDSPFVVDNCCWSGEIAC